MAQVAIPLMIGGGLLQANSQFQAGQQASRNATIVAGQLEENAKRAEYAAGQQKAIAQKKAAEDLRQNRRLQSRQIAIAAASGASTSSKNIADLISKTSAEGEYAALTSLYEGDIKSDQLLNEANNLRRKAVATQFEGRAARKAGNIGAFSTLLQTGAQAGSFYGKYGNRAPMDNGLDNINAQYGPADLRSSISNDFKFNTMYP